MKLTIDDMKYDRVRFGIGRCTSEFASVDHVRALDDQRADQLTSAPLRDPYAAARPGLTQPVKRLPVQVPEDGC